MNQIIEMNPEAFDAEYQEWCEDVQADIPDELPLDECIMVEDVEREP